MRDVAVLGVGLHPWGKFDNKPLTHMYRDSVEAALKDAGVEWREIQAVASAGSRYSGGHGWGVNGNEIVETMGLTGIPVYNLMAGCAAGGYAFNVGYTLVATGMYDLVMVAAGEKTPRGFVSAGIEDPNDTGYITQAAIGMPAPAIWAMMTRRRMVEYGTTEETLAKIAVKAHKNAAHNPYARYRQEFTVEDVLNSPMVCDPLHLYEICPMSDGAAAVILGSPEEVRKRGTKPVWLAACAVATTKFENGGGLGSPIPPSQRIQYTEVYGAVTKALQQAGIDRKDVDFCELGDNIVTFELMLPEEWGFLEPGEADLFVQRGETGPTGKFPINPSGGFNTFGDATTAMGIFEVCEATWQLRGQKGATQVPDAKVGLTQTYGAGGNGTCCILKR